ncbi:MAG: hypothetical protein ACE5F3_02305 [Mariprofundaceae bacterium]
MEREKSSETGTTQTRRPMPGVPCSEDPEAEATFYCANCQRSFCEDCVGLEDGVRTYCLQCAVEREGPGSARRIFYTEAGEFRAWVKRALLVMSVAIVGVNVFIIISSQPAFIAETVRPPMSPQLSSIVECRHRLELIAAQAMAFQKAMDRPPESLSDVAPLFDDTKVLRDPVTHQAYILEFRRNEGITVSCPTPGAHGLAGLFARPGKPAKMVYLESGDSGG